MNPIDTLTILVTADYTGLKNTLSQATSALTNFISESGSQQVNWIDILSGSFTPALITTIASTFALSIEQALKMQNAVTTASQTAGSTFGSSTGKMSQAAIDLSQQTGESATDIATAMGTVGQTFKDTATAQAVLNAVTEEAYIKGTSVSDMAKILVPLFKEWNVHAGDVSQTMADINAAIPQGTISSFSDLIGSLTNVGPAMRNYISLSDAATESEIASSKSGMDSSTMLNVLQVMATAIQNPLSLAGILFGNIGTKIKDQGIGTALQGMADKIKSSGEVSQTLYGQTGLVANSITNIGNTAPNAFGAVDSGAKTAEKSVGTLKSQMSDSETYQKDLMSNWNKFTDALLEFVVPDGIYALNAVLKGMTGIITSIGGAWDEVFGGTLLKDIQALTTSSGWTDFKDALKTNLNAVAGGVPGDIINGAQSVASSPSTPGLIKDLLSFLGYNGNSTSNSSSSSTTNNYYGATTSQAKNATSTKYSQTNPSASAITH